MSISKAEFSKYIIKQETGTLYLKLREEFNTYSMTMHHTMAQITRTGVRVIKTDSEGEVSSTKMVLTTQEFAILAQGFEPVQHFWNEQELPERHVLLECGCIVDWDATYDEEHVLETGKRIQEDLPFEDAWAWCPDHEEARIYRFNVLDFSGTGE